MVSSILKTHTEDAEQSLVFRKAWSCFRMKDIIDEISLHFFKIKEIKQKVQGLVNLKFLTKLSCI